MPIYCYKCDNCGKTFEIKQSIKDKPIEFCPDSTCRDKNNEKGKVHRVISKNIGLLFQGSGFYITDYPNKLNPNNHSSNINTTAS